MSVENHISNLKQQPQSQRDLNFQIRMLRIAANKLGLYDAADWLRDQNKDIFAQ